MRPTQLFSSQLLEGARDCVLNCGPHNNPKGIHFHMGGRLTREYDYAFMWHLSCFVGEGATLYIDGEKLYDEGHLTLLDDPEIRRRAAAYGDANSLLWEVPLQG